jgi:integrase
MSITDRGRAGGYRLKTEASAAPIPITEALVPILIDWLTHRLDTPLDFPVPIDCPWLFPNVNRRSNWRGGPKGHKPLDRLRDVAKRAGVEGLTFLALRHSFASHLEAHGAGPAMIQRLLRHSNPTTQMWYRHADRPGMTDAISGFDF